jgi:hypothetical protein
MAVDVAVFGSLFMSPEELAAWKRVVVDSSRYRGVARVFPQSPNLAATSVAKLLKELPAAGGYDLFRIEREDGMYCVRGQFDDRAFRKHARQLAALFMTAADVGILGDVYFLGQGVREGYALQLSGGSPTLLVLEDEEIERRSRDPMLDAISTHMRAASGGGSWSEPPRPTAPWGPLSSARPLLSFPRRKP